MTTTVKTPPKAPPISPAARTAEMFFEGLDAKGEWKVPHVRAEAVKKLREHAAQRQSISDSLAGDGDRKRAHIANDLALAAWADEFSATTVERMDAEAARLKPTLTEVPGDPMWAATLWAAMATMSPIERNAAFAVATPAEAHAMATAPRLLRRVEGGLPTWEPCVAPATVEARALAEAPQATRDALARIESARTQASGYLGLLARAHR